MWHSAQGSGCTVCPVLHAGWYSAGPKAAPQGRGQIQFSSFLSAPSSPRSGPGRAGHAHIPHSLAFLTTKQCSPQTRLLRGWGWCFLPAGCWPSGWGSESWYRAEHAQQALSIRLPIPMSRVEVGKIGVCSELSESGPLAAPILGRPRPVTGPHWTCRQ